MRVDDILGKFEHFGVKLGLESSLHLLTALGNPHQKVPILHVAGSNGKGSVCAYLSAILTQAGYRVGRYTSPHLVSWNERICLNDEPIAPDALEQVLEQVTAAVDPAAPPTQFEVITAAAWLHFAQQQVDIAVMEVGLGGRLDATNVCDRPLVTVITSISREHWQRLGPTLADIAFEKAGILKPGCPAVVGQLPAEARAVVDRRIAELGCPAVYPEPAIPVEAEKSANPEVEWADYQGLRYPLPLRGAIQLHNSALAIAAIHQLRQQGWKISDEAIVEGMAKTRWAGRLQWFLWQGNQILIDGAHNPASAAVLRQYVDSLTAKRGGALPVHWVMGMLSTKDHREVFEALLKPGDRLYLVPVPDHSSADPVALATLARDVCPELAQCNCCEDVLAALKVAIAGAAGDRALTILCGSLYLIGHFFSLQRQENLGPVE